jgi:hypothetical protein
MRLIAISVVICDSVSLWRCLVASLMLASKRYAAADTFASFIVASVVMRGEFVGKRAQLCVRSVQL